MEASVGDHAAESIPNGAPYLVFISYICCICWRV